MRVVVMAYQDIGYAGLDELLEMGAEVVAVVSHPDDPHEEIWFRSVADRAREAGVPVLVPPSVNDPDVVRRLAAFAPDLILSIYFRDIIKPEVLALAPRGALNLHGSLLPRYRGRCPVNWVLIHGESETGVTLHHMEARPDMGDIVAQRAVPIDDDDTALTLNGKLGGAARVLLRETFPLLVAGTAPRIPQDHARATTFGGRRPEDGRIVWPQTARQVYDLVRAVTHPYPGAFTWWRDRRLFVWQTRLVDGAGDREVPGRVVGVGDGGIVVTTGGGALRLERVQLAGGPEEEGEAFARRIDLRIGDRLGEEAA